MSNSDSLGDGPNYAQQEVNKRIGEINTANIDKWGKKEPSEGDISFDTAGNESKIYMGGKWVPVKTAISDETKKTIADATIKGISINTDPIVYSTGSTGSTVNSSTGWSPTGS